MNIDYVIISADDSHYLDFYKPVSIMWNHFGFKTFMLHITETETEIQENKFGLYKKVKAIPNYQTSWQAQLIRLYAFKYLNDVNMLISDIDMVPLNKNYFIEHANTINEEEILNYSGQPYGNLPYFPMCYILGNSNLMSKAFDLNDTFENFLHNVAKEVTVKWNADEHYMFNKLNGYNKLKMLKNRTYLIDRIDRSNWTYDVDGLKIGKYIDSHMLRPYKENKTEINKMLALVLGINDWNNL